MLQAYEIEHERLLWMRRYKTIILQNIIMPINNDDDGIEKEYILKVRTESTKYRRWPRKEMVGKLGYQ